MNGVDESGAKSTETTDSISRSKIKQIHILCVSAFFFFFIKYSYRSEDAVSLGVSASKEAEFLLGASCCPWRRHVSSKVGHYVNVNHA